MKEYKERKLKFDSGKNFTDRKQVIKTKEIKVT